MRDHSELPRANSLYLGPSAKWAQLTDCNIDGGPIDPRAANKYMNREKNDHLGDLTARHSDLGKMRFNWVWLRKNKFHVHLLECAPGLQGI